MAGGGAFPDKLLHQEFYGGGRLVPTDPLRLRSFVTGDASGGQVFPEDGRKLGPPGDAELGVGAVEMIVDRAHR